MYNNQTYELIKARILNSITANIDKREGSFIQDMISPIATEITKAYIEFDNIINIAFVENSYDEYLDMKVNEFGVYRKEGVKATGIVKLTGVDGTVIPSGTIAITSDGLRFILSGGTIVNGVANIVATSEDIGKVYNILSRSITKLEIDIFGVDTVTNENAFAGGINRETDEELKVRFFINVQNPVTSGNKYHYEQWALEVDGIGNAKVIPLWDGPGTVKVVISDGDNRPVSSEVINECKNYIESIRPIGAEVTISTPGIYEVDISVLIEVEKNYSLDEVVKTVKENIDRYLIGCNGLIIYTKIGCLISDVTGVRDYGELLINGDKKNISVSSDFSPQLNNLNVTGGILYEQ